MDHNIETLGTELVLPLAVKDRLLGFLSLGPKMSEEPFTFPPILRCWNPSHRKPDWRWRTAGYVHRSGRQ